MSTIEEKSKPTVTTFLNFEPGVRRVGMHIAHGNGPVEKTIFLQQPCNTSVENISAQKLALDIQIAIRGHSPKTIEEDY